MWQAAYLFDISIRLLLLVLFVYFIFNAVPLVKGIRKNTVFLLLLAAVFFLSVAVGWPMIGTGLLIIISFLFVYFYNDGLFSENWYWLLPPAGCLLLSNLFLGHGYYNGTVALILMLECLFLLLSYKRGYLHGWNAVLVTILYIVFMAVDGIITQYAEVLFKDVQVATLSHLLIGFVSMLLFGLLEMTLSAYEKGFLRTTKELREQMIGQQYEEIQSIYLNVRGWRHDYHNHIQVLKTTLKQGQYDQANAYLDTIENALRKVDTYVKSGNVMADAILNSKLSLAEQKQIPVTCDAFLPETLLITDVDLCTLLGNVLDNAIESCERLSVSERFIRVYMALNKEQFYLSVQNATVESPNENQKQLMSKKKGDHGLGVNRVAAVVKTYEGFLNINQQPGVFAVEVMMPLSSTK